jgi:hypothetical protein
MTRISSGIKPIELCDKMLLAEHREIIRIPNTIKSGKAIVENVPNSFRLGAGHVKFFYNKGKYLFDRYKDLHQECLERGFNVQNYSSCFDNLPPKLYNDWQETDKVRPIVIKRINERLANMKNIKYYSEDMLLINISL